MALHETYMPDCRRIAEKIKEIMQDDHLTKILAWYGYTRNSRECNDRGRIPYLKVFCGEKEVDPGGIVDLVYDLVIALHPAFYYRGTGSVSLFLSGFDLKNSALQVAWAGFEGPVEDPEGADAWVFQV